MRKTEMTVTLKRPPYDEISFPITRNQDACIIMQMLGTIIDVEGNPDKKESPADEIKETNAAEEKLNGHLHDITIDEDVQEATADVPKETPEKDLAVLAELLADGMSKKRIADHFCVSMSTIYNWCNELDELNDVYDKSGVK